ncbi:MAG TPA: conjugal transfer protein TraC [Acidimicrobiia bacterium]|nr:conjugal transfer protein TraC [Acidimicrobiia bacterium]
MRHRGRFGVRPRHQPIGEGLLDPSSVEVTTRDLGVDDRWRRTMAVTGYPREVRPGWLQPLVNHPGAVDVALHVEPLASTVAAQRLRRQLARLESSRRLDAARGRLADPDLDVAASDARELADRVARGDGRLFSTGLYVTVRGDEHDELERESARLRAVLSSLLLDAQPATWRALPGWITTLPLGLDQLGLRRTFDTSALAAAFPFASADLPSAGGVLYGLNRHSRGLVMWDRFAQPNYNSVILARSGAGKSYLAKLEALRSLYEGIEVAVVDPEDEYRRLADATGGAYLPLGASGARLNPFDLGDEADALTRRALFLHTLVPVLIGGGLDPAARAALDRAVIGAYGARGITADARTHRRPPPLLADLAATLDRDPDPAARTLAQRLAPFVHGSHRQLFDGPTTTHPDGHLVVFSLRDLAGELKGAGTLLVLDALWRRVSDPARRRRRLVVVDEAWLLMRDPEGARFLFRLAKAARKYWCGLTVVTQDAGDLLGSELGQAVVANAATQILLRQAPQAIDRLAGAFHLSDGERTFLLAAEPGEGILAAGTDRVAFKTLASDHEHDLVTTNPAELADRPGN